VDKVHGVTVCVTTATVLLLPCYCIIVPHYSSRCCWCFIVSRRVKTFRAAFTAC